MPLPALQPYMLGDALSDVAKNRNVLQMQALRRQALPQLLEDQHQRNAVAMMLDNAQINRTNAAADLLRKKQDMLGQMPTQMPRPLSALGKTIADYQMMQQSNPDMAKLLLQNAQRQAQGAPGLSVRGLPGGGFELNTGQSVFRDPRFGTSRSGAGGTYEVHHPDGTVTVVSTPTGAMTTANQRSIQGAADLEDSLNKLMEVGTRFSTAGDYGELLGKGFSNFLLGTNYQAPSQYKEYDSLLKTQAEKAIRAYGLNATDKSIEMMVQAAQKGFGEAPEQYKARLMRTLEEIKARAGRARKALRQGITVSEKNNKKANDKKESLKIQYDEKLGRFSDE